MARRATSAACGRMPAQRDCAVGGWLESGEQAQQGGLAGPVGPEHRQPVSLRHRQRVDAQHLPAAARMSQPADGQGLAHAAPRW